MSTIRVGGIFEEKRTHWDKDVVTWIVSKNSDIRLSSMSMSTDFSQSLECLLKKIKYDK